MKIGQRVICYVVLFMVYFFSISLITWLDIFLKINNVYITAAIGFSIIDIIFAFIILRLKPILNILVGIILACLSFFFALKFGNMGLFEHYDAYNILTYILSNAVFSILFWEILYHITGNLQRKNKQS